MFDLTGRNALVTGGGRGVGRAVARKLAEHGATVVINYFHSREQAHRTLDELRALGAEVHLVRASVARRDQVEQMFQQVRELVGGLDVLVNNAASGALVPREELEERHWSRAFATNLDGSRWCAELAAPLMRGRPGSIVNLSSIGAGLVVGNYLPVGTSKAAVEALTRYLAVELAPGTRVNTASCGLIDGEVADRFPRAAEMREVTAAATPLGRVATADDLANVVLFLASDASGWITGQTILADGGLSLASPLLTPPSESRLGEALPSAADSGGGPELGTVDFGGGGAAGSADPVDSAGRSAGSGAGPRYSGDESVAASTYPVDSAGEIPGSNPSTVASGGESAAVSTESVAASADIGRCADGGVAASAGPAGSGAESAETDGEHDDELSAQEQDGLVAVVGMGVVVPGAGDPDEFWRLRTGGQVTFSEPGDRWDLDCFYSPDPAAEDRTYSRKGGYITAPHRPHDPSEEFTAHWLRTALGQALQGVHRGADDRWSFVVGYTADGSQHLEEALVAAGLRRRMRTAGVEDLISAELPHRGDDPAQLLPHLVGRRAAEGLLPEGTEPLMVDTACSSSLYSIDLGMQDLLSGHRDIAVCGGAFALGPRGSTLFSQLQGLSRTDRVRALDEQNDGVLFSDGAGVVVLKTLRRARADGDRVLGVLPGIGTSSDGRGKAIYAPSAEGQRLAVRRAHEAAGVVGGEVDWVVAHATGTPAGDLAEFQTLREELRSDRTTYVTSNKSQIGHTGWAAGVVSVIEVLLGFRHGTIPPQHEFSRAPAEFGIASTNLEIPPVERPWPGPRTAAVSGFGFGGTNAHLIVRDRPSAPAPVERHDGALAVVGWSAALPGDPTEQELTDWFRGRTPGPAPEFGDRFPLPPFSEVRIPPAVLRTVDRCQLMALKCVNRLPQAVSDEMARLRDTTGVVVGHLGPTRSATLYALRCYLGMLEKSVQRRGPDVQAAFAEFQETVRSLVPVGNENSFPGIMPNVVPARVANYFDLHGPNIAVDTGFSGGLTAVRVAGRYLRSGRMDLALACGVNGNSTPELREVLGPALGAGTELAEGAFTLALAREPDARARGLPVLGLVSESGPEQGPGSPVEITPPAGRSYLAGDGSRALIEALVRPEPAVAITCTDPLSGESSRLVVRKEDEEPRHEGGAQVVGDEPPHVVQRYAVRLLPRPNARVREAVPVVTPQTVVLTDRAEFARPLVEAGAVVVCTEPGAGWLVPSEVSPAGMRAVLQPLVGRARSLHAVTRLDRAPIEHVLTLHDALFLALQAFHEQITSFTALLVEAVSDGVPDQCCGLFTGLVKSAALELGEVTCRAVLSSSGSLGAGLAQLAEDVASDDDMTIAVHDGLQRKGFVAWPEPGEQRRNLPESGSVLVGVGGARGITAEALVALAGETAPTIWVLGTNPLQDYPEEVFRASDDEFARSRSAFISEGLRAEPGVAVAELNRRFERRAQARTARANLDRMSARGAAVHYLTCELGDRDAVAEAVRTIHERDGRIDLLLNGAGINRGAALANKDFDEFRRVRDTKVRGYANLERALADRPPRTWCNFGSLVGFTGQEGELDYASANDFLATAATRAASSGRDEFTVGWTLWNRVGLGSDPVTQSFMQRSGLFSGMGTEEGTDHLLDELRGDHHPAVVHLGDTERAAIARRAPALLHQAPTEQPFYLGRVLEREPHRLVAERELNLEVDGYLADHLVNGVPTLPGTVVPEVVSEAALALFPGRCVTAITDLSLQAFLRVHPGRAGTVIRVVAESTGSDPVVSVRVLSDLRAPNGILLKKDRVHFAATVHMGRELPSPPVVVPWPEDPDEVPAVDPYHVPNPAAHLTGSWVSTEDTRVRAGGNRATFAPASLPGAFAGFRVPVVLLDGLARTAVLTGSRFAPLAAPLSVARIEFFDGRNDHALAGESPGGVELRARPGGIEADGRTEVGDGDAANQLIAVAPGGGMLLRMSGLRGKVLGHVDTEAGGFHRPAQLDRPGARS